MKKSLLLLIITLIYTQLFAQQPPGSCTGETAVLASTCNTACVLCTGLDGLTLDNSITDLGQAPAGFCAQELHNTQWIGFVAGTTSISIDITVFNCNTGEGLQIGIYNTSDCDSYTLVSNCEDQVSPGVTTFNANGLTPGGVYFIVIDGFNGDICDFTIDVVSGLAEAPPLVGSAQIIIPPDMCPGGTYPFSVTGITGAGIFEWTLDGVTIDYNPEVSITMPSTPGSHQICVTPSNPCEQGVQVCETINVDLLPDIDLGLVKICAGDVFTSDGLDFSSAGPHSYTIVTPEGCDQTTNFSLELIEPVYYAFDTILCDGAIVSVGNEDFEFTGTYMVLLETAAYGCDSIVTVDVEVHDNYFEIVEEDICRGESYTVSDAINSYTYTETGVYDHNLQTEFGCDSFVQLYLRVFEIPEPVTITDSICPGDTYFIGDFITVDNPGTYQYTIESFAGCDSMITLNLSYYQPTTNLNESICIGDDYVVGTSTYTSSGMYSDTISLPSGCDSIVNLDLTVLPIVRDTFNVGICTGQTYSIGTSTYTETGFYIDNFVATSGCDSIIYTNLTVTDVLEEYLSIDICEGDVYMVGDSTYSTPGMYQNNFVTSEGCDSITYLDLRVNLPQSTDIATSICEGDTYFIGNTPYTTTGVFHETFSSDVTGCDSTVNLTLTVLPHSYTTLNEEICNGFSFSVGSSTYNTSGQSQDTLTAANGCDSIITLNLTVLSTPTTTLNESICAGDIYSVGNSAYTTTGVYQDVLIAANGCDSTVNLTLTVLDLSYTSLNEKICMGEHFFVGTSDYTTSGNFSDTLLAANGCDSIISLNLEVAPIYDMTITTSICDGATYQVGTSSYNATGLYQDILTSVDGCDSIVNLNLTVTNFYETPLTKAICEGETYSVGSNTFNMTGDYQVAFIAQDGCDSFVNLALTVLPILETDLTEVICQGDTYELNGTSYDAPGTYQQTVEASTGCDSILNISIIVNPTYAINLSEVICEGNSYSVGDSTYFTTGEYTNILPTVNGCDSTVHLSLLVNPTLTTNLTKEICEGETYNVGSSSYTNTGSYSDLLTSLVTGCDSIVNLNLTVHAPRMTNLTAAICEGESYFEGSNEYTTTGVYTTTYTSVETNCDSIVNLNLTVNPTYLTELQEIICDDESYAIGEFSFASTGNYEVTLPTTESCDSIVMLDLIVHPCELDIEMGEEPVSCNGASDGTINFEMTIGVPPYQYQWNGLNNALSGTGSIEANNTTETISGLTAGSYLLKVTDSFDVPYEVEITIIEPIALSLTLTPSTYGNYNLSCGEELDGAIAATVQGGTPPYSYAWSNGLDSNQISNLGEGEYELMVTDIIGCQIMQTVSLTAPEAISTDVSIINPNCHGDNQGQISISQTTGGIPPYMYSIDQLPFSASANFTNVNTGTHQVIVQDAFGCEWREEFEVEDPEELTVDLGADIFIELGDETTLTAIPSYGVDSIIWKQDSTFNCLDISCKNASIHPYQTTDYEVRVIDENGCTASDKITVFVDKPRHIFIPTAFSPNGDNINDILFINGGQDVAKIKSFSIFNRWGESVFSFHDFLPNDPEFGWDGKHRGRLMNTGVFIYTAEVEFIDGAVILYKGDVVLIK